MARVENSTFARPKLRQNVWIQVLPSRVRRLDQIDLPLPAPLFELLLTRDSIPHIDVALRVDQTPNALAIRMFATRSGSVLPDAAAEVVCHANVKRTTRPAGEDVEPIESLHGPNHIVVPGAAQHEVVRC